MRLPGKRNETIGRRVQPLPVVRRLGLADEGVDLLRLAHEVPGQGELVVAVVEHQRPAAGLLGPLPPGDGARRHVPGGRAPPRVALDADGERRADRAFGDQLLRPDDRGIEQEVLEHLERTLRGVRGRDQAVGLLQRDAHRLLQRDDLAGGDCLQRRVEMQVMGEQDLDEIHLRAGEQGIDVVVDGDVVEAPGRRPLCRARGVHVAERDDPRQRARQVLDGVQVGDAARAHDADSDGSGLHGSSAPVAAAGGRRPCGVLPRRRYAANLGGVRAGAQHVPPSSFGRSVCPCAIPRCIRPVFVDSQRSDTLDCLSAHP